MAGRAGGEFFAAEGEALAIEGEALAGDFLLVGAADDFEKTGGGVDLGIAADEELVGEEAGAVEGRAGELGEGELGEGSGGFDLGVMAGADAVALPVGADGALADGDAELGSNELSDAGVAEVLLLEPNVDAGLLLEIEALQPGVAAHFAHRLGHQGRSGGSNHGGRSFV